MIRVLENPLTKNYLDFKDFITSPGFLWSHAKQNYSAGSHPAYFTHPFIVRACENEVAPVPIIMCEHTQFVFAVVDEILKYNDRDINLVYRMNLNMTYAQDVENPYSPVHTDHVYPHENLLIYFTGHKQGEGGQIIVGDEEYYPKEDDVIIFPGTPHYMKIPNKGFRVALVMTYLGGYTH
mgnify:CR=1 FL=1|tara:strand:- start:38 stop:577 length:540 start_codon:yes stop_codon:yes gene_type:complete